MTGTALARHEIEILDATETQTPRVPARHTATPETNFAAMMSMADVLVKTGFLPKAIRTPAQAVAIIMTGRELGIPTMHALRSINVIEGKPAMASELMLALFNRKGGKSQVIESDNLSCEIEFTHPNGTTHVEAFTIEDAKAANLAHKDNWKKFPKAMLRARCLSAGLRIAAPDIIAGLYDPEELGAEVTPDGEVVVDDTLRLTGDLSSPHAEPTADMAREAFDAGLRAEAATTAMLGPDSAITWGKAVGTKIRDLDLDYLKWAVAPGRKFGAETEAWQVAMRAELESRVEKVKATPADCSECGSKFGEGHKVGCPFADDVS